MMRAYSRGYGRSRLWSILLFYFVTVVILLPFLWMVVLSFKTNAQILSNPFDLSSLFTLHNYSTVLSTLNIFLLYKNTFLIALPSVVIEIVITFMSSYVLTRMVFPARRLRQSLYYFLLLGLAIPSFILLFPVYRITIALHLTNTYTSLILPYIATSISFNTLLFTGFLRSFPVEIEEAAIVDGSSLLTMCTRVVFPMMKPVVITVFIFNMLYIWNEFPFAVTLISSPDLTTISLGISQFQGMWSIDYGAMIASGILIMIPQLIFYGAFQRYIVEGMTAGAVKG